MKHLHCRLGFFVLLMLLAPGLATASTPQASPATAPYELDLLAVAEEGANEEVTAINASGTMLGTSCSSGFNCQPVVWTASGDATMLAVPPYRDAWAPSINDEGLIVGSIEVEPDAPIGALWLDAGEYTTLQTPDGSPGGAMVINNRDRIAGAAIQPNGAMRLVMWTAREPAWIDPSADPTCSLLWDMNDRGVMVGQSSPDCEIMRAAMWNDDGLTLLPTLNPEATPHPNDALQWQSTAWAINESGAIVGFALDTNAQHAVIWQDDGIAVLEEPPGATGCSALGINDNGTIAGGCFTERYGSRAVVWVEGAPVTLPGDSGVAYDLNNDGVIVGHVAQADGHRAAMWVPTDLAGDASLTPAGIVTEFPGVRLPGRRAARSLAGTVLKGGRI